MKGGHRQANQLHELNWCAFAHETHAPQVRSCLESVHEQKTVCYQMRNPVQLFLACWPSSAGCSTNYLWSHGVI